MSTFAPPAVPPDHSYSLGDITAIVGYARERGIAVLPELDMPGHSTRCQNTSHQLCTVFPLCCHRLALFYHYLFSA